MMFSHVMLGTNDIEKAKAFWDKVLGVLGAPGGMENTSDSGHKRVFYMHDGNAFGLSQPINDQQATSANGMTIGLKCSSEAEVRELHDVAVANGGTTMEDPPGLRETTMGPMHLCYFRDPDGHKICGIHRPG
jgi:catechol 2,3-dioxygenase-like lactoylglutathione lyase family enzyme